MKGVTKTPESEQELNTGQKNGIHLRTLRVQSHLVVLDGEIGTSLALPMRNLHKVSTHECFADIHVMPSLILV